MLDDVLNCILLDLNKYKRNKREVFSQYIAERLNKSAQSYAHDLQLSLISLKNQNSLKIIKEDSRNE